MKSFITLTPAAQTMDKLKLTLRNLGWVFNSSNGHTCIGHTIVHLSKQPNLYLKSNNF